jgi:hypothetical protein
MKMPGGRRPLKRKWHLYGPRPDEGQLQRTLCNRIIADLALTHRLYIMPPGGSTHDPCERCADAHIKSVKDAKP